MTRILVLGTGRPQADLIRKCKALGMDVHACSYCRGGAGEALADHFALIDIVDADAVRRYAQDNGIELIYSAGSDVAMPVVGEVSEALGLPLLAPSRIAKICNNKGALRDALGNSSPWNVRHTVVCDPAEDVGIPLPFMMKPVDSQGQRGVSLVRSMSEYKDRFGECIAFSRAGAVILEEYVDGEEISVNTYSLDGEVVFELASDRVVWDGYTGGLIHEHLLPSRRIRRYEAEVLKTIVHGALKLLGLQNGPAYFQIKLGADCPKIIEVTPRLDGCHMWRLIRTYAGVDLLDCAIRQLAGDRSAAEALRTFRLPDGAAGCKTEFLCQPPGTAFCRENFRVGSAQYLEWYLEEGEIVPRMNGFMEKCGYQIVRDDV